MTGNAIVSGPCILLFRQPLFRQWVFISKKDRCKTRLVVCRSNRRVLVRKGLLANNSGNSKRIRMKFYTVMGTQIRRFARNFGCPRSTETKMAKKNRTFVREPMHPKCHFSAADLRYVLKRYESMWLVINSLKKLRNFPLRAKGSYVSDLQRVVGRLSVIND